MENSVNHKNERNSSFELLRIISMLLIVFHHFSVHGKFSYSLTSISFNRFWIDFMSLGGKVGVNLFVLISGYFLINKDSPLFNFKRILKLWGQMFLYSVVIYFLFVIFGDVTFSFNTLFENLIPVLSNKWWFASTYLALFMLHPFINMFLRNLSKKQYQILILLLVIIWSLIPTLLSRDFGLSNLGWFVTLYIISGYIRLYGFNPKFTRKHYILIFIFTTIITFLFTIICAYLGKFIPDVKYYTTYLYSQHKLSILLISVSLFMIFVNIKLSSKLINTVSSTTFGIYLIHDNNYIRPFLWETLFNNNHFQHSGWLILYSIGVCLLVFVVCFIIDLIRIKTIEKCYLNVVNKYSHYIETPCSKLINKLSSFIFGNE